MANYNNTYGRAESTPRYSRNSKMDLEARRRSGENKRPSVGGNATTMNYSRATTRTSASRGTSYSAAATRQNSYGRTTATSVQGSQRVATNYGRTSAPVSGVRRGATGINSRKVTTMGHPQVQPSVYQEGNTMRYAGEAPLRRKEAARKGTQKSVANKRRKSNAGVLSFKYSVFLASVTLMVAGMSMSFLNVQSNVNTKASLITTLQKNIADLSVENDSAYGAISQNMNMEAVKDRAEEMGMEYADSTQVVEYDAPMEDTVKQYETIPTSGVLAQSERTSE